MATKKKPVAKKKSIASKSKPVPATKELTPEEAESEDEKKRRDWEFNNSIIIASYTDHLVKKQKLPSYADIARECNLSVKTVERHLQDLKFDDFINRFRAGNEKVMLNLFKQAATGKNHHIMRLWFDVVEKLGSNKKVDVTSGGKPIEPAAPAGASLDLSKLSTSALKEILTQVDALPKG